MELPQILLLVILSATVAAFLWDRWRHDIVAAGALLACVLAGLVDAELAFAGFGHPAVITVACVLVLSRGLQTSGAVDLLTRAVLPASNGKALNLAALVGLGTLLSSFMNNVGALALLMPVALPLARRIGLTPGQVLMPLAFGTLLGGMTTLIGTPPNLIVSAFRAQAGGAGFAMFDFTPVGLAVAAGGVAFIVLVGWRLVPAREQAGVEGFESGAYLTEARVDDNSSAVGQTLGQLEKSLDDSGGQIVGLVHRDTRITAPNPRHRVRAGDILVIEAEAGALATFLTTLGLTLVEAVEPPAPIAAAAAAADAADASVAAGDTATASAAPSAAAVSGRAAEPPAGAAETAGAAPKAKADDAASDIVLMELAVLPGSALVGNSASDILLRTRYGLNLLALSRQGQRSTRRLRSTMIATGDLLLMQGPPEAIGEFAGDKGCVPLPSANCASPTSARPGPPAW